MFVISRLVKDYRKGSITDMELALAVVNFSEELDLNDLTLLPEETMAIIKKWVFERDSINEYQCFNSLSKTFIKPSGFQCIRKWIIDHKL